MATMPTTRNERPAEIGIVSSGIGRAPGGEIGRSAYALRANTERVTVRKMRR